MAASKNPFRESKQTSIFVRVKIEQTNLYCSIIKHFVLHGQLLLEMNKSTLVALMSHFIVIGHS